MILVISAQQPTLDSPVDERFGRAPWLIKFDTETSRWEALPNPGVSQSGGAGVAAAQFVIDQKVTTAISGDFGPHAAAALKAAGVEMRLFTGEVSTVQQAVQSFLLGKLPAFG